VKICSLYGAGFYYLPGTDICVKHGAYVRFQSYYGFSGQNSATNGPFFNGVSGQQAAAASASNDLFFRSRAVYTLDARTQTEYGTLRAYALIGYSQDSTGQTGANTLYATRGFIQFAGFTLGKATSFFDIWSGAANSYFAIASSDMGDSGQIVAGYTFQFGNGFSASIAAEDPRKQVVTNTTLTSPTVNPFTVGALPTSDSGSNRFPDIVANLRVDQAWGSFQIMGAIHDNSGAYFLPSAGITCGATSIGGTLTGDIACGRPQDELGFAVGAGGIFKIPMPTGLTDIASFQVNYSEGASRYVSITQFGAGSPSLFGNTGLATCPVAGLGASPCLGSLGVGFIADGVMGNPGAIAGYDGSVQSTKVWGVNAAWDHLWTPNLKTSVYGAFIHVDYNGTASALMSIPLCSTLGAVPGAPVPLSAGTQAGSINRVTNAAGSCDPDFSFWQLGTRTQWNITPSFYVGFDVMYQKLETAFAGSNAFFTAVANQPRPSGTYQISDQDTLSVTARAHWDILP
jgi:porin-like protein